MTPEQAAHYQLLRLIEHQPEISQRDLAQAMGVSLGKTHYLLKALLEKGLVKANNFRRSDNKLAYAYLLTPSGFTAKLELAKAFLRFKEVEYEVTRREIELLRAELESPFTPTGWFCFDTVDALYDELSGYVSHMAAEAISLRGRFCIAITGGQTVVPLYRRLAKMSADWDRWYVYWTDERCVEPTSEDRNSKVATDAWLSGVSIPQNHLFPIPGELGSEAGAGRYEQTLAAEDMFDLVLLSLGEDGHVASIFPGASKDFRLEIAARDVLPVFDAPKLPRERISLSLSRLARSRTVVMLAAGREKREAFTRLVKKIDQPATRLSAISNMELWFDKVVAGGAYDQR